MNSETSQIILDAILKKRIFDYILFDKAFRYLDGSSGIVRYLGALPKEGDSLIDYFPEIVGGEDEILAVFEKHYSTFEIKTIQKNNYYVDCSVEYYDDTAAILLLFNATEMSSTRQELMQNHNEVSLLLNMLQHIIDSQNALLFAVDRDENIKFVNRRFREYFGMRDPELYRHVNTSFNSYAELAQYLDDREEPLTISEETFMIQSANVESVYTLFTLTKVTTIFNENQNLLQKVQIDTLTGVYRKKVFEERLGEIMRAGASFAVAVADLDNFKQINDTYGHPAGDEILRQFAAMMREEMKGDELVARWGGEEFLMLIVCQVKSEAFDRLERMCRRVAAHDFGIGTRVTVSMGAAWCSGCPCETTDTLFRRADHALYEAKNNGKNQVIFAPVRDCETMCS